MTSFLKEYQLAHGIPEQAAMGGAETMYPEFRAKAAKMPAPMKPPAAKPAPAKPKPPAPAK